MSLLISFKSKLPFRELKGIAYCIWEYEITEGIPGGIAEQIGIGLSSLIDIQDPAQFADTAALFGTRLEKRTPGFIQFVYAASVHATPNKVIVAFVAPCQENSLTPVMLVSLTESGEHKSPLFHVGSEESENSMQMIRGPAAISPVMSQGNEAIMKSGDVSTTDIDLPPPVFNGRPVTDFVGTLPYASEIFGVYQPLAGWFGRQNSLRVASGKNLLSQLGSFTEFSARQLPNPFLQKLALFIPKTQAMLSPVGLVTLFREYFFEFDTFLGVPNGHLWISPGGTVEVVESSTRRTLVEKTAEQSEETTRKAEESLTSQEDVADAIKEDNANDTKLGASASAGAKFAGIYHADASASLSVQNTTKKSSEDTHKHTRTQSSKVSSEIHRNFKTTFKTVTETTDTSSRRYVVQNTTLGLVNYELRRKMRKVGIQVQHIGTRLSWQVFLDMPGKDLGLGELVHVVPAPDLSSIKKPDLLPPLAQKVVPFTGAFPITKSPGTKVPPNINQDFIIHSRDSTDILDAGREMHIVADLVLSSAPPTPGYTLALVSLVSAKSQGGDITFVPQQPIEVMNKDKGIFHVFADRLNSGNLTPIQLTFDLTWDPPLVDPAKAQHDADVADYNSKVAEVLRAAYAGAVRDRLKLVSGLRPRPSEDLRSEERQSVFGNLIRRLQLFEDPHIGSELIRQIFDVDEMLYFVAPEFWRPSVGDPPKITQTSQGKYPIPKPPAGGDIDADYLAGDTVVSWYSHTAKDNAFDPQRARTDEWRINYLITEDTRPAPAGSSLGWLIQIDGDERRNEFLNASWVKAVLPVRAGHEIHALDWLAQAEVEGEAGLSQPYLLQSGDPETYEGKTLGEVLLLLATELQTANTDMTNTLASEKVFESGFDPLEGGFRPAEPYEVFDQWLEVLPTDQIVAVEVKYDPKTGKQI